MSSLLKVRQAASGEISQETQPLFNFFPMKEWRFRDVEHLGPRLKVKSVN